MLSRLPPPLSFFSFELLLGSREPPAAPKFCFGSSLPFRVCRTHPNCFVVQEVSPGSYRTLGGCRGKRGDTRPVCKEVKPEPGLDVQQEKTSQVADTEQVPTSKDVPKVSKKLTPTPPKAPPPAHLLKAREVVSATSLQAVGETSPTGKPEAKQDDVKASSSSSSSVPSRKLPSWNASIAMTREAAEQLKLQAVVLDGDTTAADAMIRTAGKVGLWISRQIPFEDLSSKAIASLKFLPSSRHKALCADYAKHFFSKGEAGVVNLQGSLTLYIIPPAAIQACGLGGLRDLHGICLVGAITPESCLPDSEAVIEDANANVGRMVEDRGGDCDGSDQRPAQVDKPLVRTQTQPSAGSAVELEGNELQKKIDELVSLTEDRPSKDDKASAASNNASSQDPEDKSTSNQEVKQPESTARSKAKASNLRTSAKSKKKARQSEEQHGTRRETVPQPIPHRFSAPLPHQTSPAHPYQQVYPPHHTAQPFHPPPFYPSYAHPVYPVYPAPPPQPYLLASINAAASHYARQQTTPASWPIAFNGPLLAGARPDRPQDEKQSVRERKRHRSRSRKRRRHRDHERRHKDKKKSRREKGEKTLDSNKVTEQSVANLTARLQALIETDGPCSDDESSNSSGHDVASEEL